MRIVQQLREISCPSSLSLVVLKEKLKTRGRKRSESGKGKVSQVGKKRETHKEDECDISTKRNPSHFEYVLEPDKIPEQVTKQVKKKVHRTRTCLDRLSTVGYRGLVPMEWLDHIERVDDVRGDGN
ncbi:hypothetical protein Scep_016770 [Stephania cephalantha]|uniref:Uncharacterized protein n=1 Tax=Stephania cephalantha TaxID=152367 RepID=A0AAP0INF5_9MAGN